MGLYSWSLFGATKDASSPGERGAGHFPQPNTPGAVLASGCLGAAFAWVLPFQYPERARERRDQDPVRSASPRTWRRPAPPGNQGGGLIEGRDKKDLSEFIIDCESHHPLSGP
jgi:hypothetical protein